jgi:hypothetical protein
LVASIMRLRPAALSFHFLGCAFSWHSSARPSASFGLPRYERAPLRIRAAWCVSQEAASCWRRHWRRRRNPERFASDKMLETANCFDDRPLAILVLRLED